MRDNGFLLSLSRTLGGSVTSKGEGEAEAEGGGSDNSLARQQPPSMDGSVMSLATRAAGVVAAAGRSAAGTYGFVVGRAGGLVQHLFIEEGGEAGGQGSEDGAQRGKTSSVMSSSWVQDASQGRWLPVENWGPDDREAAAGNGTDGSDSAPATGGGGGDGGVCGGKPQKPLDVRSMDMRAHQGAALCVAFSAATMRTASGGADGTIRIWSKPDDAGV